MPSVDDILSDPFAALALPEGSIPCHIYVICEYLEPGSDNEPGLERYARTIDDNMTPWQALGLLGYATIVERDNVSAIE